MDIINKKTFQYVKLENCVKDELLKVETTDGTSVFFYAGTQKGAKNYINNGFKEKREGKFVIKKLKKSTSYTHTIRGDVSFILIDIDGKDVSKVDWKITRFSPLVNRDETKNLQSHNGFVFAQHALHSKPNDENQSMISYWEQNVGKDKTIDLDNFTCPCCGKKTKHEDVDGAHIKIEGKTGQFITPTCKDCNEYKVVNERYFKVKEVDVVKAP